MNALAKLFLLLLTLISARTFAGSESHGAFGYVESNPSGEGYLFADFLEFGDQFDPLNVEDIGEAANIISRQLDKMASASPRIGQFTRDVIKHAAIWSFVDAELKPIKPKGNTNLIITYKKVQVAIANPIKGTVQIVKKVFFAMTPEEQAFVIFHDGAWLAEKSYYAFRKLNPNIEYASLNHQLRRGDYLHGKEKFLTIVDPYDISITDESVRHIAGLFMAPNLEKKDPEFIYGHFKAHCGIVNAHSRYDINSEAGFTYQLDSDNISRELIEEFRIPRSYVRQIESRYSVRNPELTNIEPRTQTPWEVFAWLDLNVPYLEDDFPSHPFDEESLLMLDGLEISFTKDIFIAPNQTQKVLDKRTLDWSTDDFDVFTVQLKGDPVDQVVRIPKGRRFVISSIEDDVEIAGYQGHPNRARRGRRGEQSLGLQINFSASNPLDFIMVNYMKMGVYGKHLNFDNIREFREEFLDLIVVHPPKGDGISDIPTSITPTDLETPPISMTSAKKIVRTKGYLAKMKGNPELIHSRQLDSQSMELVYLHQSSGSWVPTDIFHKYCDDQIGITFYRIYHLIVEESRVRFYKEYSGRAKAFRSRPKGGEWSDDTYVCSESYYGIEFVTRHPEVTFEIRQLSGGRKTLVLENNLN